MARTTDGLRWLTPDATGGDAVCRPLLIPPEYLPYVSALLDTLTEESRWFALGDITPADAAAAMQTMMDNYYSGSCV